MNNENYTNEHLEEMAKSSITKWKFDSKELKIIPISSEKIPIKVLYRIAKELWVQDEYSCLEFPFIESNFKNVLGLANGWRIERKYLKMLENDMLLFANDGATIIKSTIVKRWWETTWFNIICLVSGVVTICSWVYA